MRPNGRTLYKVLHKSRRKGGWGGRFSIMVRLPASLYAECVPPMNYAENWGDKLFLGQWSKKLENGLEEFRHISCIYSPLDPGEVDLSGQWGTLHFVEKVSLAVGDEGVPHWSFWTGTCKTYRNLGDPLTRETLSTVDLPIEDIIAHKEMIEFRSHYFSEGRGSHPVLSNFQALNDGIHQLFFSGNGKWLFLTYFDIHSSIEGRRKLCAGLKRAFRIAHENGVDARLIW